jgi:hypothetical protein
MIWEGPRRPSLPSELEELLTKSCKKKGCDAALASTNAADDLPFKYSVAMFRERRECSFYLIDD